LITETDIKGPNDTEPTDRIKSLDYSKIVGVLIEAIKELNNKVETLESKLNGAS
jgi:biotin-(acetyl-CoA carboxylase) ligase